MNAPLLEIQLFGPFAATIRGEPLPRLRSRKGHWLLALLALRADRDVPRVWLAETLWPDSEPSQARYNLRQCLTNLRPALGAADICLRAPAPQTLRLDGTNARIDLSLFDAALADGSPGALERAVALHRGPLLEGCDEEWAVSERAAREQGFLGALSQLAASAAAQNRPDEAVRHLRRIIAADPFREAAYAALMQALADCGDGAAIVHVYRDLRQTLHRELNARPAPETETLYRRLREQEKPSSRSFPPPSPAAARETGLPPRRLPVPLTALIGREEEVASVAGGLQSGRLVTLTGAGGVGKTRLSLAVGATLTTAFADGVWFVELGAITDGELVAQTVARALCVREATGRPLTETLSHALASRALLLILDNCEHLLPACARLADRLLADCPGLRVLATSRQPLGLTGERVIGVPALALPPERGPIGRKGAFGGAMPAREIETDAFQELQEAQTFAAIQLFVERAALARADFRLTRQNVGAVVAICRQLDGLPLALELAAARVRAISVAQIEARLGDEFGPLSLSGGSRTALPRHQTLRALMDWSYALLTGPERNVFRRLSVFAGGWTLEAAHALCSDSGSERSAIARREEPCEARGEETASPQETASLREDAPQQTGRAASPPPDDFLDLLTSLADKSLVVAEAHDRETRYRMLATLREYARQKLEAEEDAAEVQRRHCDYFVALAEGVGSPDARVNLARHLDRVETEYDNLRAALAWCRDDPNGGEAECRMAQALYTFWYLRGPMREGREYLLAAARRAGARHQTALQARLLVNAGALANSQGDFPSARAALQPALALAQAADARHIEASALLILGSIALAAEGGATATPLLEAALTVARRAGYSGLESECLACLGGIAQMQGEYEQARAWFEQGLAAAFAAGGGWHEASLSGLMAELALEQGDTSRAQTWACRSLQVYLPTGDKASCLQTLDTLAGVALAQSHAERAAHLLAAIDARVEAVEMPLQVHQHTRHLARIETVRAILGAEAFDAACRSGRRMSWEAVIAYALEERALSSEPGGPKRFAAN